jgi:4'-phosphopantetheinyl transferase
VVAARTEDVLCSLDRRLLTAAEVRRCASLRHQADRDARTAARLLLRWAAARLTGRPVETLAVVQRCSECGSVDHGRPSVPSVPATHVSLAHSRGAVAVGVGWSPVGVDIEPARPRGVIGAAPMSVVLTDRETRRSQSTADPAREFLRHWTLKECLVKMGVATLDTASWIEIDTASEQRTAEGRTASRHGQLHLVDWFDDSLDAVVAAAAAEPPVVASFPFAR